MREIKFRGWNTETKTMIDLYKITPLAVSGNLQENTDGLYIPFSPMVELMQYTGLKDKNGKEIYEGDIVKRESENGVVRWDDLLARFRVYMDSNKPMPRNYPCWTELLEVIGNIYENKELLS